MKKQTSVGKRLRVVGEHVRVLTLELKDVVGGMPRIHGCSRDNSTCSSESTPTSDC
jgi:hypothetical protein